MSQPKDRLQFWLPTSKWRVFMIFFGLPFLAVWGLFSCPFSILAAMSDRPVRGNLHPFIDDLIIAIVVVGFEFGLVAGFVAWFLVAFRNRILVLWTFVLLMYAGLYCVIVWVGDDFRGGGDDWRGGISKIIGITVFVALFMTPLTLMSYLQHKQSKIPRVLEPDITDVLRKDEVVQLKCSAIDRNHGAKIPGWLFVTTQRVLFAESDPQSPIGFAGVLSISLDSVVKAIPGLTLNFAPEELRLETTKGLRKFDVEDSWDLVVWINHRKSGAKVREVLDS